jgi:ribonuclease HII
VAKTQSSLRLLKVPSPKTTVKVKKKRSLSPSHDQELASALMYPAPDYIIGLDEVGRGCLAGPVFAGSFLYSIADAEIIATKLESVRIIDSKMLDAEERSAAEAAIASLGTTARWSVEPASVEEIDEINIHHASLLAMNRALVKVIELACLSQEHRVLILVDGSFIPKQVLSRPEVASGQWKTASLTKGDGRSYAIAAAAIAAKEARDRFMRKLAIIHPQYRWEQNVGYGTPEHRRALTVNGITSWHRKTFQWQPLETETTISEIK